MLVVGLSAPAYAQRTAQDIASARQLYNDAIDLRDKGDLKGALEKFRAAHALGNTPITGLDLCRTHSALGQPIEAREACLSVARIAPIADESERSKGARGDAASLAEAERGKIGALRIKITGVPAGAEPSVVVDGITVPPAALSAPRAVNPGKHVIVASVNRGPEARANAETREGETRDVELAVTPGQGPAVAAAPVAATPAEQPSEPPKKKSSTLSTVSFGVAGVAGLVGLIAGVKALSAEGDLADNCENKICGRDRWNDLDSAQTAGNVATGAFIIAGVALGVGFVSAITSSSSKPAAKARVQPAFGFGGGGLHGSF